MFKQFFDKVISELSEPSNLLVCHANILFALNDINMAKVDDYTDAVYNSINFIMKQICKIIQFDHSLYFLIDVMDDVLSDLSNIDRRIIREGYNFKEAIIIANYQIANSVTINLKAYALLIQQFLMDMFACFYNDCCDIPRIFEN